MATNISAQELDRIKGLVQSGELKTPKEGTIAIPGSSLLYTQGGDVTSDTGEVLGKISPIAGTSNYSAAAANNFDMSTGIKLPDQPVTPGATPTPSLSGLSTSLPAVDKAQIEADTRKQYEPGRSSITADYGSKIEEAKKLGAGEEASLSARLGLGRRMDTAAASFLKFVSDSNAKKVADLEMQKQSALNDFDFKLAGLIDNKIKDERTNQQNQFENILKLVDISKKQQEDKAKTDEQRNDTMIGDVMAAGETNPVKIFSALRAKGIQVPASQVAEIVKKYQDAEGAKPGIVGEWIAAKENDPEFANTTLQEYLDIKNPGLALELENKRLNNEKLQQELGGKGALDPNTGKIMVNGPTAGKINSELTKTDAYKAVRKAQDSLQFLSEFEKNFKELGLETLPGAGKGKLRSSYMTSLLNLKEFFNLGVLNGPDMSILQGIIPDPTTGFLKTFRGRASSVEEGIKTVKKMVETTLDDRYTSIATQYGDYSPTSVTALKDLQRIYVDQKAKLNPKVQQLITENPDLSDEDIIQLF